METWRQIFYFVIGLLTITTVNGRQPFTPLPKSVPYIVYFMSHYRGICVGTLLSRTAVLTASVCCVDSQSNIPDKHSINVVVGSQYRHMKRGIRVQVVKLLIPTLPDIGFGRKSIMQKSVTIMILKRAVPDALVEIPMRAISVNYDLKKEDLALRQECFTVGWHFFYKGDKIYEPQKFLIQRNMRVQIVDVVKKRQWCEPLAIKFHKALEDIGYGSYYEPASGVCVKDPDRIAQACHGMYGAPLICRGQVVAVLTAPDAQWRNCTGMSNLYQLLSSQYTYSFMKCMEKIFKPDIHSVDIEKLKKMVEMQDSEEVDFLDDIYDTVIKTDSNSSNE